MTTRRSDGLQRRFEFLRRVAVPVHVEQYINGRLIEARTRRRRSSTVMLERVLKHLVADEAAMRDVGHDKRADRLVVTIESLRGELARRRSS